MRWPWKKKKETPPRKLVWRDGKYHIIFDPENPKSRAIDVTGSFRVSDMLYNLVIFRGNDCIYYWGDGRIALIVTQLEEGRYVEVDV